MTTKENISRAKGKIVESKTERAVKAAEQRKVQAVAEQNGSLIRNEAASCSPVSDVPKQGEVPQTQTEVSRLIRTRQQGKKTIKITTRNAKRTVKIIAKGMVKVTEKDVKTTKTTSKATIKTTEQTTKAAQKTVKAFAKAA